MAKGKAASSGAEETLEQARSKRVYTWLAAVKSDRAERLAETKRLFGGKVACMDPHTHSNHSDGKGTVEQNQEAAVNAGLDFVFASDHRSLGQKRNVKKFANMSWGQEPGAGAHHLGLLCNERLFKPKLDEFAADFARASKQAPFVWIPHPAGWYPRTAYSEEKIAALWTIGRDFAVEVLNGAHKVETAYDRFDEAAIAVWDRLLCDGRRVTPLGGSDAHAPEGIGCVWTAVLGADPEPDSLIKALNAGRCQATEASLLDFRLDGQPMGSAVKVKKGQEISLSYRAVDAAGIQCVRIVSAGKVRKTLYPRDKQVVEGEWKMRPRTDTYCRLESRAVDNRRAYSAPIYLEVDPHATTGRHRG